MLSVSVFTDRNAAVDYACEIPPTKPMQTEVVIDPLVSLLNRRIRSRWAAYGVAVACPSAALLLVAGLGHGGHIVPVYLIFTLAISLSALVGGFLPGLLSVGLSLLYIDVGLSAHYIPLVGRRSAWLSFVVFGLGGIFISKVISALRDSQKALRESSDRYRSLFESIDEGFCVIEILFDDNRVPKDWRYLEVNPAFQQHVGLEQATGKTIRELMPDIESRWLAIYGNVAVTGEAVRLVEFSQAFKRWFDLYAFRIGQPEQHRVAVLFNDITERKQAEEALLRSEKLASVGQMAVAIAHEINNPLEAVTNLLFITRGIDGLPAPAGHLLETADAELRRVAHIARQSLGFYRESTTPTLTSIPVVLDSTIDLLKSKIKAKHAVIEKQWDGDVQFKAVAGELRQVFSNLLANSLDAIQERDVIKLRITATKHHVRISIADNGRGIDKESRQHVFDPFFTTKGTTGTGLGLWVSKQIVEKHGGVIQVRSKVHCGTVFSVLLKIPEIHERASANPIILPDSA